MELQVLHNILNNLHPDIIFTIEYDITQSPFLDVPDEQANGKIDTDMYYNQQTAKGIYFFRPVIQSKQKSVYHFH